MPLAPGTRIGPYQLVSFIGAGGMGAVYRARDTRLNRDVALKIMSDTFGGDQDRVRRFQQEAQAAGALNDANILAVYDVGIHDGAPYLVSELLEGETLRMRLRGNPLSPWKTVDYSRQIALGLATAHSRGITHRDIKPENLFVTSQGRIKILDFGLAKVALSASDPDDVTVTAISTPGVVLGTASYMSPEQVRGEAIDHRSDIFSLGCVLYEMATGTRAFDGRTDADRMSAVLKDDPPFDDKVPLHLQRTIRHCLEKNAGERFQNARDLAFDLESITQQDSTPRPMIRPNRTRKLLPWLIVGVLALTCMGLVLDRLKRVPPPVFHRLTFSRGAIHAGRFTPDGASVIYSARWEGGPSDVYIARADVPGSRSLGFRDYELRGVSPKGELALVHNAIVGNFYAPVGTLALAPYAGGTPRDLYEKVAFVDWSSSDEMAVVRATDHGFQLEYPAGTVLYKTAGYISQARISPSGQLVAFLDHAVDNSSGVVAIVDRKGTRRVLGSPYAAGDGLAWEPHGKEVWYTAASQGARLQLRAVDMEGHERIVYSQAKPIILMDISRDGRVLVANDERRMKLIVRLAGDEREHDLSWLDWSLVESLSPDSQLITFSETAEGAGSSALIYIRETNGAPPVMLGEGHYPSLSPDGTSVVSSMPNAVEIYPVHAGQPHIISIHGFTVYRAGLLQDGQTIWFRGNEPGKGQRYYLTGLDGASPRAVTPEGYRAVGYGPILDGEYFTAVSGRNVTMFPVQGGEPRVIAGQIPGTYIAGWTPDHRELYVFDGSRIPFPVERLDWKTGKREHLLDIEPSDSAGLRGINTLRVSPDGKNYVYSVPQQIEELHSIEGLK
ncbi:MAG TPA: protein kinase [Bryobacteraceae bacterium]